MWTDTPRPVFRVEPFVNRACWPLSGYQAPVWKPYDPSSEWIPSRIDVEVSRGIIRESSVLATGPVPGTGLDTARCVDRVDRATVQSEGFTWNHPRVERAGHRAGTRHRSGHRPMRLPSRSCHGSIRRFYVEPSASRACWPPGRYQAPVWTPPDALTKSIVSRFDPEVSRGTNGEPSVLTFASARHRSGNRPMRRPSRSWHGSIRRFHVEPTAKRVCWPLPVPGTELETVRCVDRVDRVTVRSGGFTWNHLQVERAGH